HDDDQVVALVAVGIALHGERHGAGQVHRKVGGAGREATDVQTARAHGLDFRGIALDLVEHDLAVDALGQVFGERREDVCVDGRVFYGRVGEHQRGRVAQLGSVGGRVGHQVAVGVAVHRVKITAVGAVVLSTG